MADGGLCRGTGGAGGEKGRDRQGKIKAATPNEDDEGDGDATAEVDDDNAVDEARLKAKQELGEVKKKLKVKKATFEAHLNQDVAGLSEAQAAELLLTILHDDMRAIVERYITQQRQQIIAAVENWWDKYKVTLTEIEQERDAAARELRRFLEGLGYV